MTSYHNGRVTVWQGDCREVLRSLPDESVHCVVTGRFLKGRSASPETQFKPGQHWRPRKPHWEREWLVREYVDRSRSTGEIPIEIGTTDENVIYWLRKHGIKRRSTAEARAVKHWGCAGDANPMFGKFGAANPHYIDGSSPERQRLYSQGEGREFLKRVYARDGYKCVRCGSPNTGPKTIHAHHIRPWAGNVALRFDESNAVTLCRGCHGWVHSKRNVLREYIA